MLENQARRLTAILAADIADYSKLTGADEARTVETLKSHQAVVLPMVGSFKGRIIDTAGDGILAEFASVVNAVDCAIAIQRTMAKRNAGVKASRRMQFRIGVNLGDVIYDKQKIFGDGVNLAARLEQSAEPGSVSISEACWQTVDGRVLAGFSNLGMKKFKNISKRVRVYRIDLSEEDPIITLRRWLKRLRGRDLANVVHDTGIPTPTLTLFVRGKNNLLTVAECNSLLQHIRTHENKATPKYHTKAVKSARRLYPTTPPRSLDNPPIMFHLEYPGSFPIDLQRARSLKAMGTSLRRLGRWKQLIRNLVAKGGTFQALFINPGKSELLRYETIQEFGSDKAEFIAKFQDRLLNTASWCFKLRGERDHQTRVEIRAIDYPLAFGIDEMGFDDGKRIVYVQFYPIALDKEETERTIVEIGSDNAIWYPYYAEQLERHWDRARDWFDISKFPDSE